MNDREEDIGTEIRTKVYHLPEGGRVARLEEMKEHRAARRLQLKKDKRRQAWVRGLVAWNIIMWPIVIFYYAWKWEDIFR